MRGHRLGSFKRWKGIFQGVLVGKLAELSHSLGSRLKSRILEINSK